MSSRSEQASLGGPAPPTRELSGPGVLVGARGSRPRLRKAFSLVRPPGRPQRSPFQFVLRFPPSQGHYRARWDGILRRPTQESCLSQRPHLLRAGLSQASAAPHLPVLQHPPPFRFLPSCTWSTRYRWFGFGSGSGSCSGSGSRGVLVRLRAPDALPALIPRFLPLPPSPPHRLRAATADTGAAAGGGEGRMERDAGWLVAAAGSGQLWPRKEEEMGGAAAATLGSQMPSPVAGPGPGAGAQVFRAESEGLARL